MQPLIKVPAIVGTILTVALVVASALSSFSWAASIASAAVTVLTALSQVVTVKKLAAKPTPAPTPSGNK